MKRSFGNKILIVVSLFILPGCDACTDDQKALVVQGTIALANEPPFKIVRIAGYSYLDFDKGDPGDGYEIHDGYLKVWHTPNCGRKGNEGTDKFFSSRVLPAGCQLLRVDFEDCRELEGCSGNIFNNGKFDSGIYGTHVKWYNTCTGACKNFTNVYNISFVISMPTGIDIGETVFPYNEGLSPVYDCGNKGWTPPAVSVVGGGGNNTGGNNPTPCNDQMKEVCASWAPEPGYVILNVLPSSQHTCGVCQTYTVFKPCDNVMKGATYNVLINSPVPAGWEEVPGSRYCDGILQECKPCDENNPNKKQIRKK